MRTIKVICLAVLTVSISCCINNFVGTSGNGIVKEESRNLENFQAIENASIFNVYIAQGSEYSFQAISDENILPLLRTHVSNGTLYISMEENSIKNTTRSDIFIRLKSLEKLVNQGVGKVETKILTGTNLKIENQGVGNMSVEVDFQKVDCRNEGVGSVKFKGIAKEFNLVNNGVGSVDAKEIDSDIASVENSGVGSVKISCNKELSIVNTGVGSVRYWGDAIIKHLVSEGVGSVKKGN